jgi:hypothetical protein
MVCLAALLGGCIPFAEPTPLVVGPNGETATPTPNATQLAIMRMLTETRAAPTATLTPVVPPTDTATPTTTPAPLGSAGRPVGMGERLTAEGIGLTVLSTQKIAEVSKRKAAEGNTFLDVEALIEAAGEQEVDYTPLYFRLVDAQDNAYQPSSSGAQPAIQSGRLRPGEWVRGHVTFEIPAGAGGLRLRYSPEIAAGYAIDLWVDFSLAAKQAELPDTAPVIELGEAAGAAGKALPVTGQRDEGGGIALTVERVTAGERVGPTRAAAGSLLVTLDVTVENVARAKSPFNAYYFTARDDAGYEYPSMILPLETLLQGGSLGQGQKVSGQVVFEVPESTKRLVVEYQPQVLVEEYPVIRFLVEVGR